MIEVSDKIINYLGSLFGEQSAKEYVDFIKREPTLYIRVNTLKASAKVLTEKLSSGYGIVTEPLPDIPNALKVISGKDVIGKTVEHIIGDFYIQGLSSMIPPLVLAPSPGDTVLDLCAAPGSKTTQLGSIMENKGVLLANEIALDRVKMLVYNIDRMNLMNAGVMHYKGEMLSKIYDDYFDKILVDAPCSGLGIIQKKGEVSNWWSLERAERLGDLQLRLLIAAIKMVKTGGEIVYSTCTLTPEENEFIIDKVLEKYPVELIDIELPVKSIEAFTSYNGRTLNPAVSKARRIIPWQADTDGFFVVKMRKTAGIQAPDKLTVKPGQLKLLNSGKKEIAKLLNGLATHFGIADEVFSDYSYLIKNTDMLFINNEWEDDNLSLFERIGTRFGIIDRNGEITMHTQAAQILGDKITGHIYDIDNTADLKTYLEGGTIKGAATAPGQCIIKYKGSVLGTAVVTGSGIKSRFPRAKRTQEILYY